LPGGGALGDQADPMQHPLPTRLVPEHTAIDLKLHPCPPARAITTRPNPPSGGSSGCRAGACWRSVREGTGHGRVRAPGGGGPFPRPWGQFPTRDQYVAYLHEYAATRRLRVRTGVQVERVDPAGTGWRLTTSAGPLAT